MSSPTQPATPGTQPAPVRSSFPQPQVLAACQKYGPLLNVPEGLTGWMVMLAIAAVESGGGDPNEAGNNCGPRHEPAYDVGGAPWARNVMAPLLVEYPPVGSPAQSPAAMSYGPWQMMFVNCPGATPYLLLTSVEACAQYFVHQFNSYVEAAEKAGNLDEIGEVWNAGHITADPAYTNKLTAAYQQLAGGN
jgi:hypothetical protein